MYVVAIDHNHTNSSIYPIAVGLQGVQTKYNTNMNAEHQEVMQGIMH